MDQKRIGRFIADCRKSKGLTQLQLAQKLDITDKAVSKWERGLAMPDVSVMLELCDILVISINELLNGERISMEKNNEKNEQLLLEMAKELEKKNKTIWSTMWVILVVSLIGLLTGIFAAAFFIPEGVGQIIATLGITAVFLVPCFYVLKLEIGVGVYKCKKCGHEIVPAYREALLAMHMGTTRYLKCPGCNKRSWCKKVIKK